MGEYVGITITRTDLARMYPRALPDWLDALARLATPLCRHYRFDRLDWCGIAGQIDAECDGLALAHMAESMSYSAERMLEVYSKRLGDALNMPVPPLGGRVFASKGALARALAHKPKELADVVYGGPHGREGTPAWQGSRFIGRGPLQETHLKNYRAARDEICRQPGGVACPDLLERPELLASDPELGVRDVFAQWKLKGLSKYARAKDWATLSDVLNTGNPNDSVKPFGLQRRLRATARALAIWPEGSSEVAGATETGVGRANGLRQGDSGPEVERLQARLSELGYISGPTDGSFGVVTTRALVAFQSEHNLPVTGEADARTLEVLAASAPSTAPGAGPRKDVTAKDLEAAGSQTISYARRLKRWALRLLGLDVVVEADNQLGLNTADHLMSQVEQAKGLVGRGRWIVDGLPMPSGRLVAVALIAVACAIVWRLAHKIEWRRVLDARTGLHIGRIAQGGKP